MPRRKQNRENPYVIDVEEGAETTRLMHQDRLTTRAIGGVLPELFETDLMPVGDILDIGCGPGGWVLDTAYTYPKTQVVGADISTTMIEYARAVAKSQGLENAHFRIMDALKPLDFPDHSFDLIHARFITGFMSKDAWPLLIKECRRITRPGGILHLTEFEAPISNSLVYETLNGLVARALYLAGRSFSPDGRHYGIVPMLGSFLQDAGYQHIEQQAHAIDYSAGTDMAVSNYHNNIVFFKLIQPFLIKMGITTQEEVDTLYDQLLIDLMLDTFRATWFLLTVWGRTPP